MVLTWSCAQPSRVSSSHLRILTVFSSSSSRPRQRAARIPQSSLQLPLLPVVLCTPAEMRLGRYFPWTWVMVYVVFLWACPWCPAARALDIPSSLDGFVAGVWSQFSELLDAGIGDSRAAIIPLKHYFAQFGYLNVTAQNVTDVFDTDLLSAVKLYQESFGLDVSGKLDLKTLSKIMTPRCGREDVLDGIPLMLQSTPATNATTTHTVQHYAFFPSQPKWPSSQRNLSYAFSSLNETGRVSSAERRAAFTNAFAEWAAVVPINFTEIESYDDADIKIEFVSFAHGDGKPFDGVLGVLAHAFSPTDGRFHLDDSEYWQSLMLRSSSEPQDVDLQSVVTHEIGHLIGLAHSPVEEAIMYPSIAPGQVKVRLQLDDIQGAQVLYGANPNYTPDSPLPGVPNAVEDVSGSASEVVHSFLIICNIVLCIIIAGLI